jgi:DNA-binding beta-propeller fold protein YncE
MLPSVSSRRSAARRRTIRRRRLSALAVPVAVVIFAAVSTSGQEGKSVGHEAGPHARAGVLAMRASRAADPRSRAPRTTAHTNLRPGSNPGVLPGPVLIADRDNNRLLEVSPAGRVLWRFPAHGDLVSGETFLLPDDAFYSPDGRQIVVTQEDDFAISIIDLSTNRIVYRYGHPGVPGPEPGYVHNPDDAMLMSSGELLSADIKNCRVLVIRPPGHRPLRQLGITGDCEHELGVSYGSPNGAFPMSNGDTAVTEINGDWLDVIAPDGKPVLDTHPPGFTYPSDTNEVRPGLFLSVDYTNPGAIETFTSDGQLLWRYEPTGSRALDRPSLALPLPNGDIFANDDKNQRVIVVDPRTNKIVWQYGHTHVSGAGEGFLSNPDGVDLAPPYSLTQRFAATLRAP